MNTHLPRRWKIRVKKCFVFEKNLTIDVPVAMKGFSFFFGSTYYLESF